MPQPDSARKGDLPGFTCVRTGFLEGYTVWAIGWSRVTRRCAGGVATTGRLVAPLPEFIPTNMPPLRGLVGFPSAGNTPGEGPP
jgi:hypothetical protein